MFYFSKPLEIGGSWLLLVACEQNKLEVPEMLCGESEFFLILNPAEKT